LRALVPRLAGPRRTTTVPATHGRARTTPSRGGSHSQLQRVESTALHRRSLLSETERGQAESAASLPRLHSRRLHGKVPLLADNDPASPPSHLDTPTQTRGRRLSSQVLGQFGGRRPPHCNGQDGLGCDRTKPTAPSVGSCFRYCSHISTRVAGCSSSRYVLRIVSRLALSLALLGEESTDRLDLRES